MDKEQQRIRAQASFCEGCEVKDMEIDRLKKPKPGDAYAAHQQRLIVEGYESDNARLKEANAALRERVKQLEAGLDNVLLAGLGAGADKEPLLQQALVFAREALGVEEEK